MPRRKRRGDQCILEQVGPDTKAVVVHCDGNKCHQNFKVPSLPAGQRFDHDGVYESRVSVSVFTSLH